MVGIKDLLERQRSNNGGREKELLVCRVTKWALGRR
jgi:hypothetical protein